MSNKIPLNLEETGNEVLARIIKATARKYNCSMVIDFNNGNRTVEFIGDEASKPLIIKELNDIFKNAEDDNEMKEKT